MQKEYLLPASILIAGVLVAGSLIYTTGAKNTANVSDQLNPNGDPKVTLALTNDDVVLGSPDAPVTFIEYSDFQCPFCGRFFTQSESLIKENFVKTGKVKMVYRHFAFLGPESVAAAEAVECAKDQGKFWEYHDQLFTEEIKDGKEHNGNLNGALFDTIATRIGLDNAQFSSCLADHTYAAKVQKDFEIAGQLGVEATPTVFVNGAKVEGALPYSQFEAVIKTFLK